MKNFELVRENAIEVNEKTLYQIRALVDYPNGHAKAGDLGGYIEKEENLSDWAWVSVNAQVYDDACVFSNARVHGNARVFSNAQVYDDARIFSGAWVYGDACVYGNACVFDNAHVFDNAQVYDNACVFDEVRVYDNTRVYGNVRACDDARIYGNALVYGNARVYGDARVSSPHHVIWFSNVGIEDGTLTAYKTKDGSTELTCGCFCGTIEEFIETSKKQHDTIHHQKYMLLIEYIKLHFSTLQED